MPCSKRFEREFLLGIMVASALPPVCGATPTGQMPAAARCACGGPKGRRDKCEWQASRNHRDIESTCMQVLPEPLQRSADVFQRSQKRFARRAPLFQCPGVTFSNPLVPVPGLSENAEPPLSVFESNFCSWPIAQYCGLYLFTG